MKKIIKKAVNICRFQNNAYLCIAFEKQGNSHEEFWRGGRVVDCGGLETVVPRGTRGSNPCLSAINADN